MEVSLSDSKCAFLLNLVVCVQWNPDVEPKNEHYCVLHVARYHITDCSCPLKNDEYYAALFLFFNYLISKICSSLLIFTLFHHLTLTLTASRGFLV